MVSCGRYELTFTESEVDLYRYFQTIPNKAKFLKQCIFDSKKYNVGSAYVTVGNCADASASVSPSMQNINNGDTSQLVMSPEERDKQIEEVFLKIYGDYYEEVQNGQRGVFRDFAEAKHFVACREEALRKCTGYDTELLNSVHDLFKKVFKQLFRNIDERALYDTVFGNNL